MFITPLIKEFEEINKVASKFGLKVGETCSGRKNDWSSPVAFGGNTYPIKDQLKALGCKFDGTNKVWIIGTLEAAQNVLSQLSA